MERLSYALTYVYDSLPSQADMENLVGFSILSLSCAGLRKDSALVPAQTAKTWVPPTSSLFVSHANWTPSRPHVKEPFISYAAPPVSAPSGSAFASYASWPVQRAPFISHAAPCA